jgi:hypothetical protein
VKMIFSKELTSLENGLGSEYKLLAMSF